MRLFIVAVSAVLYPALVLGQIGGAVRAIDHSAAATLQRGLGKSALIRTLLADLSQSDVIVHVEMSQHLPAGIGGMTRFVAGRGGHRYLRVTLSSALPPDARVAMLGHELQHVREVAQSTAAGVIELEQLWQQQGYRINGRYFETDSALRVERAVRRELRSRASEAKPVVELHHEHLRAGGAKAGAQIAKR